MENQIQELKREMQLFLVADLTGRKNTSCHEGRVGRESDVCLFFFARGTSFRRRVVNVIDVIRFMQLLFSERSCMGF